MQAKDIRKMFWSSGSPIANLFRFPANFANGVPAVPFGQDTMEDKKGTSLSSVDNLAG
jgi:hypothetical protein